MQKYDRFLQKSVEQKNSRSLETKIVGIIRRDNFFFLFFFDFPSSRGFIEIFYSKRQNVDAFANIERKLKEALEVVINLRNGTFRTTH